jgi:hypothetical protein
MASTFGVKIKTYHCDGVIMASKAYKSAVETAGQTITFSSINAHHQDGIAERQIQTVQNRAHAMLFNAMFQWPEAITTEFWPFALKMAVDIHNVTPLYCGLTPDEIFSSQKGKQDHFKFFHTFGCPVFVLDPKLQKGQCIPKCKPSARQAVYLGLHPDYSQTVPDALNLSSGLCSAQFHSIYDICS